MPLKQGKSSRAFETNVKTELAHGKPLDQSLAISYAVKRKSPKKAAAGGLISAATEPRPSTQELNNDRAEIQQTHEKPKYVQGGMVKSQPKKYPKMAEGILKVRRMGEMDGIDDAEQAKLRKQEEHLQEMAEGGEVSFDRESRPSTQFEHHDRKEISDMGKRPTRGSGSSDMDSAERASLSSHVSREMGEGPEEDRDPDMSPIRESYRRPAEDDYMSDHEQMLAEGGIAEEDPHDNEMEDEHNSSIAAAVMAREKRMAKGGEIIDHSNSDDIHSHGSMDSDSSDEVDLSRNADEDANEEDQASYDALRKENYSEEDGLRDLSQPDDSNETSDDREMAEHDENDRVGAIMRKMSRKR